MSNHPKHSFAGSTSTHRRSRQGRVWIWALLGLFAFCCISFIGLIVAVGVASPETSVYPGSQVPSSYLKTARELGALGQNEKPKFFYSDGLVGIESGFYLVTDTKLAIYSDDGRDSPLTVLAFSEIASAELTRDESFFEDSVISIETKAGEYFAFPVSSEYDRDELFFEAIESKTD